MTCRTGIPAPSSRETHPPPSAGPEQGIPMFRIFENLVSPFATHEQYNTRSSTIPASFYGDLID